MNTTIPLSKLTRLFIFAQRNGFKGTFEAYVENMLNGENEIRARCGLQPISRWSLEKRVNSES